MKISDHEEHTRLELGDKYTEVHEWLDEYWDEFENVFHRDVRHNSRGVEYVRERWGKWPAQAAIEHIKQDCGFVPTEEFHHCKKYNASPDMVEKVKSLIDG